MYHFGVGGYSGGVCVCIGREYMGTLLSAQFCYESKIALRKLNPVRGKTPWKEKKLGIELL